MKAAVIVFPASNCDRDVQVALAKTPGVEPVMVWHKETELPKVDLIVLPGGFAFGDYLRAGAMAAHSPVMYEVRRRAERGTPVLGICNGFQVLTEAGLLPGAFLQNAGLKFVCKDVHLKVETSQSLFTSKYESGQVVRIPIAHHEGNYFADDDTLRRLEENGQVAFRYCSERGAVTPEANPNGAARNIAGIFNESKTVLGLMPHPERLADPALGGTDGQALFDSLAEALS
ncbi:MAG TPA: phosphoribosylformylglycinamidine synthase subunit PurQ [Alphaproteobacteria bacterium]|nr:phosphoribosylformylglycinamidine synthase subunit PurQ [Alphaproteobacteria bacterium]